MRRSDRQRPPSAAAEDRNTRDDLGIGYLVGSGRRPRRPRIATPTRSTWSRHRRRQRPPSAAAEDRNIEQLRQRVPRPRQRPPSAAAEDRNNDRPVVEVTCLGAAASVRGGRGSQHELRADVRRGQQQRPPSAAAEDRNTSCATWAALRTGTQRPPSAAAEDRNPRVWKPVSSKARASSGRRPRRPRIATPSYNPWLRTGSSCSGRRPRIATLGAATGLVHRGVGSGRRPRRPRIATRSGD